MLNQNQAKPAIAEKNLESDVRHAIQATQDYLLEIQHQDGHWCGELEGDTILESEYILTMHFIGSSNSDCVRKSANSTHQKALPKGGWAIYEGGPAKVSASAKAYF